ncbi:S-layer family protein, partial [Hyella patelloides]|uniref:S-layer family protein n=1 Tax=Hyella patelloides TaxID=1982969 RepID=UPI001643FA07
NIRLQGKNIRLQNGSDILNITLGTESGGQISLVASDNIELTSLDSEEGGNINASLSTRATGKGADITIKARNLFLQDESVISTGTIGAGDAGNVTIETDRLLMGSGAGIIAIAFSAGDAGNITIKTDRLLLRENAEINTSIFSVSGLGDVVDAPGVGDAGDILIQASDIELMNSARISSSTNQDSIGNAGNLTIETDRLALRDSSLIDAGTFSAGDGSDLLIQASEIVIDDSLILTSAELGATGNAGDLTIETNNLSLQNGGRITSETFGMGNAGDVMIRASESLTIDGTVKISSPENEPRVFFSGIFANAQPDTIGNSGSVKIETNELQITNDGQISVSNLGSGNSGDLYITANQLNLDSDATIEAIVNVGDRGNINLTTNNIFLRNNNQITAQAIGTATGGNIMINNRDNLVLQNNSQIIADAIQGNGGNITITTQGLFVDFDSSISASSQFGLDGNIRIDILNGDRLIELTALPINPIDATQQVTSGCGVGNDFALSGKGGLPENPTQTLRNQTVWQDTRLINRDATDNQGANSNIKRKLLPQTPILEAQAWKVNHRGKIELFATTANSHFFPNFSNCAPNPE